MEINFNDAMKLLKKNSNNDAKIFFKNIFIALSIHVLFPNQPLI